MLGMIDSIISLGTAFGCPFFMGLIGVNDILVVKYN